MKIKAKKIYENKFNAKVIYEDYAKHVEYLHDLYNQ
jgi:hypothetical protein